MFTPAVPARRLVLAGLLALALLALALTGRAPSASAAADGEGWVRLTHLSPDTPSVNVALTSFSDSRAWIKLTDVGYGDVSGYQKVPTGRYVATMTPPDGTAASTPAITQAVVVEKDRAYTVAAVGRQADLSGKVLEDDLTPPSAGTAKIRLLQAAVSTPSATVTAVGGPVLARDAVFGSSTGYAEVPAGIWTIAIDPLAGDAPATDATVTAKPGSVSTLIVLDRREGGLTARTITDAAGAQKMPTRGRGVETGGGGLAGPSLTASR